RQGGKNLEVLNAVDGTANEFEAGSDDVVGPDFEGVHGGMPGEQIGGIDDEIARVVGNRNATDRFRMRQERADFDGARYERARDGETQHSGSGEGKPAANETPLPH